MSKVLKDSLVFMFVGIIVFIFLLTEVGLLVGSMFAVAYLCEVFTKWMALLFFPWMFLWIVYLHLMKPVHKIMYKV